MKLRYLIFITIFIPISCFLSNSCKKEAPTAPNQPPATSTGTKVNEIAVNFTAKDQNNNQVSLYDYSGKVILFEFSADRSGPCREEAPKLEVLFNDYKS